MFSILSLLPSALGKYAIIALLITTAFGYGWLEGRRSYTAKARVNELKRQVETLTLKLNRQRQLADKIERTEFDGGLKATQFQQQIEQIIQSTKITTHAPCKINSKFFDRLRAADDALGLSNRP